MSAPASCATKFVFGLICKTAALDITGKVSLATDIAISTGPGEDIGTTVNVFDGAIRPSSLAVTQ
jgi:hypothetical protein